MKVLIKYTSTITTTYQLPNLPLPEMNLIPSPSITDFVFLVGLEHTVDYLTNEDSMPRSSVPAVCAQCGCDFTPVWRWERPPARRLDATFTPPHPPAPARRLCELCVSGNVKRALKVSSCGEVPSPAAKLLSQPAAEPPPQSAAKPPPKPAAKPPPKPEAKPPPKPAAKPPLQPEDKPPPHSAAKPPPQPAAPRPLSSSDSLRSRRSGRARESSDVPAKKGKTPSSSTSQQNSKHDQTPNYQNTNDLPLSAFLDELVDADWSESSGESGMEVSGGSASEAEMDDLPCTSPETALHESEGQKRLAGAGSGEGRRGGGRLGGGRGIGSRGGRGRGRAAGRGRGSRARAVKGSGGWRQEQPVAEMCKNNQDLPQSLKSSLDNESDRVTVMRESRQDVRMEGDGNEDEFQDAVNFKAQKFGGDSGAKESVWSSMATFSGSAEEFHPNPTVTFSRPYEAFRFYWNDEILEHIVRETNRYAVELKSSSRFARDWYETNVHEIMILFAFWMMLGLIRMPTIKSCFSTNPLLKTGIFRTLMTEARYCYLNRALHFVDNATRTSDSSKLFPLGPLVGHLNAKFQEASADCNTSMGVDKKDQMEPLLIEKKKRKYHKKIFKRLLNASVLNSCMLLDKTSSDPVKTQDFRLKLVDEIIEKHLEHVPKPCVRETPNQDASLPTERLAGRQHFISRQEVDGDQLTTARTSIGRMSCMWCAVREKRRSRTVWKCKTCDVPLCLEGCFEKFHTLA